MFASIKRMDFLNFLKRPGHRETEYHENYGWSNDLFSIRPCIETTKQDVLNGAQNMANLGARNMANLGARIFQKNYSFISYKLKQVEEGLNVLGYFPLISNVSAAERAILGTVEAVASLAVFSLYLCFSFCAIEKAVTYQGLYCLYYTAHGVANVVRAIFESLPFIGNVLCFAYDALGYRLEY